MKGKKCIFHFLILFGALVLSSCSFEEPKPSYLEIFNKALNDSKVEVWTSELIGDSTVLTGSNSIIQNKITFDTKTNTYIITEYKWMKSNTYENKYYASQKKVRCVKYNFNDWGRLTYRFMEGKIYNSDGSVSQSLSPQDYSYEEDKIYYDVSKCNEGILTFRKYKYYSPDTLPKGNQVSWHKNGYITVM